MGEIPWPFPICKHYAAAAMNRNQTALRERFIAMGKCRHNMSMECFASKCPFDDNLFMEELEAFLKDFPLRMNEPRLLHRCDMALSLVGVENLAAAYLHSGKVTRRRCEGTMVAHDRWERRRRANSIDIMAILAGKPLSFEQVAA